MNNIEQVIKYLEKSATWVGESFLTVILTVTLIGIAVGVLNLVRRQSSSTFRSHRVALFGPVGSGKSTSIFCLLDEAVRGQSEDLIRLRGENTINRLYAGLSDLDRGRFPPPTPEDATNIYRFDYKLSDSAGRRLLDNFFGETSQYRVEIADFAGEHTERFFSENPTKNINKVRDEFSTDADDNFLKWLSESDRCVLYIDAGMWKEKGREFTDYITNRYMAFWQRYLDLHSYELTARAGLPVVILFSKIDLLIGTWSDGPDQLLVKAEAMLKEEFAVLISFMEKYAASTEIRAISAMLKDDHGRRLGMQDLLSSLVPRRYDAPSRLYRQRRQMLELDR